MLTKSCPHCRRLITIDRLREQNQLRAFLKREVIPCPHCQKGIQLPQTAEKCISVGLLFSVIIAPLVFYWQGGLNVFSLLLFGMGIAILLMGIRQNQPQAINPSDDTNTLPSKGVTTDEKK